MTNRQGEETAALLEQGIAHLQQGALGEAESIFSGVSQEAPQARGCQLPRGRNRAPARPVRHGDPLHCQSHPDQSLTALYHNDYCFALNGAGRLQEALVSSERALKLDPDLPVAHYNRGNDLAGLGPAPGGAGGV